MMKSAASFLMALVASSIASSPALAAFKGSVEFTAAEIQGQNKNLNTIIQTASNCLEDHLEEHQRFFQRYGISAFYGDRSAFAKMSTAQKKAHLASLGKDPALLSQMKPTSCVGLTLTCLGKGFVDAGQAGTWKKIADYTKANDQDGTAMQDALRKLGWVVLYWNPDPTKNAVWDAREKAKDPQNKERFWGYHVYRYQTVTSAKQNYYFNAVDDIETLVGFKTSIPAKFANVPFYVGTAHTGYHVFPGSYGNVIEGHSTRSIDDPQTLESSEFNPLKDGGGPRGTYRSGLIAVPPGYGF
jgi:hypothetical protein